MADRRVDSLRAHHFLCLTTYAHEGYSSEFVENMDRVWQAARQGNIGVLEATAVADPICMACPNLQDAADAQSCSFQASIARRDGRMLRAMGWSDGQKVDFEPAMAEIHARHRELMAQVCGGCQWVPFCSEERFTLGTDAGQP